LPGKAFLTGGHSIGCISNNKVYVGIRSRNSNGNVRRKIVKNQFTFWEKVGITIVSALIVILTPTILKMLIEWVQSW